MKAPLLLTVFLTGCAEFSALQSGVATHGAQAADSALEVGKWEVCKAASIGALERDLANDPDRVMGWLMFCGKKPGPHPLIQPQQSTGRVVI